MDFGAFVEIAPGKEGLVHISKLDVKRTEKVSDIVNVDDEILVKITDIDDRGRINLSRKDAIMQVEGISEKSGEDTKSIKRNNFHKRNQHKTKENINRDKNISNI